MLADDHGLYRDGLRAVLSSLGQAKVVGEASTGAQAVALATDLRPDVVLMDLNMPELNGIEATRQIVAGGSGTAVLVLTMLEDAESLFAAMRAGARGYLLKDADESEILRASRRRLPARSSSGRPWPSGCSSTSPARRQPRWRPRFLS